MAGTTDPRAAGFVASEVRDALRFAMNMGLPETPSERVTFRWSSDKQYNVADNAGNPYDFTATPAVNNSRPDVQIDAAVEFMAATAMVSETGTVFGGFQTPSAVITVLDEDYPSVEGADKVLLGGDTFNVVYVAPPIGLFDMTIYQIHARARDKT